MQSRWTISINKTKACSELTLWPLRTELKITSTCSDACSQSSIESSPSPASASCSVTHRDLPDYMTSVFPQVFRPPRLLDMGEVLAVFEPDGRV